MKYYKVLSGGKSCNGGELEWSLPVKNADGSWTPGEWMPTIRGKLIPCEKGYHVCEPKDLFYWLNEEIYGVEIGKKYIRDDNKGVTEKARLLRKIETWNERTARLFACDCAEKALSLIKKPDARSVKAIEVARLYADGKATDEELAAADSAAYSAAYSAARSAAYSAAHYAADSAAYSAAYSAASAAYDAARSAASAAYSAADSAAYSAAYYAARSAADSAAYSAAYYAARSAAREWQSKKLFEYLGEEYV